MRCGVFAIICFLVAGFCAGLSAQIPERVLFQPGTYAVPYRTYQPPQYQHPQYQHHVCPNQVSAAAADEADGETAWEKEFGLNKKNEFSPTHTVPMGMPPHAPAVQPYEVPYLTYVYNQKTGRFHIAHYEPGYAASPESFPIRTSPLRTWISGRSSAANASPQLQYMSYYDPDPVILPAEIRMRGSRFSGFFTGVQPVPMPVAKPANAVPVGREPRTRIGERIQENLGVFTIE